MKFRTIYIYLAFAVFIISTATGCKKWLDIPADVDYFSEKVEYTTKTFSPVLGRTTVITNILTTTIQVYP